LNNRTPGRVEGLVRKIIKDKLNDGQLDESDLTFKDLNLIANSFVRILSGIFHNRVEYPDMSQEIERRKKNVSARKQLAGKGNGG
jgi:membrane-associated HD superfamily phosphohydrolase